MSYVTRYNALDLDMSCSLQQYGGVIQAEDRGNSQKLLKVPINQVFSSCKHIVQAFDAEVEDACRKFALSF